MGLCCQPLVLHQHNRTLSRRAAAAAEGDYAFACDFLARPQAVRAYCRVVQGVRQVLVRQLARPASPPSRLAAPYLAHVHAHQPSCAHYGRGRTSMC